MAVTIASTFAAAADEPTAVVILPFSTPDDDLAIYGKPVADAVARGLAGRPGVRALAAGVEGELPPRGDLVVELRVNRARRKLHLEAIVRDPEVGELVTSVASRSVKLSDIDQAAAELATRLGPPLDAAVAARRKRKQAEAAPSKRAPEPEPDPDPAVKDPPTDPEHPERPEVEPAADTRPLLLLYQADGQAADGAVAVRGPATAAARGLVEKLGFRTAFSSNFGILPAAVAARDARDSGARATVMMQVVAIEFAWKGVLLARGRVRVVVVQSTGMTLLDRTVSTDTVVGSRGDRHDALVRFVMRQAIDIVTRDMRKVLL